jgi:hypothetical protein
VTHHWDYDDVPYNTRSTLEQQQQGSRPVEDIRQSARRYINLICSLNKYCNNDAKAYVIPKVK